jgi:isopentenyl-diphosphate delta-isomerase
MSKIIVVNEKDEIIGYKERDDKNNSDISRVSALWIFNSNKDVLLAQRSILKTRSPGKWGPAVAGTIEEGETYESNIIKETAEEIGLQIEESQLSIGKKKFFQPEHPYFGQMFYLESDLSVSEFHPREGEVEQVKWVKLDELSVWLENSKEEFTPSMPELFKDYLEFLKDKKI